MRHLIRTMLGIVLLIPAIAHAQYEHGNYPDYGYSGGYGYGYHSSTAGEGYGRGMADVIRAQGIYNQLTAEAAVRLEEARRRNIENYKQSVETYFQVRQQNKARRDAEIQQRRYESLKWLQQREPAEIRRLSETQFDRSTGVINWPAVLMDEAFASPRALLASLFAKRAQQGGLYSIDDRQAVETATDELIQELRARIKDIHPQDAIVARHFIEALANEVFYSSS